MKEHPVTPLMPISLILTLAIITAKYSYGYLNTRLWLIATILTWGMAASLYVMGKKFRNFSYQCLFLYLCLFCLGGVLTSHRIDDTHAPITIESQQDLSPLARSVLTIQSFRKQMERKMQALHIEEQDYAVISAMALGDKGALDAETKESYSVAGTSHVLAVSGLHIAIIFQVILLLLGSKRKSHLTIIVSTTAIWAYVVLIGMPASAMRSATMISLYSFGLLSKRQGPPLNILAFAYVIMLCFNPLSLFDLSFQMSFLAVASILLFQPLIAGLYKPHHAIANWAWQLLSVSVAAQLGTMPVIVYYFGRISCYSVLTSFVAIPMAMAVLYLCAILFGLFILSSLPYISMVALPASHLVARCLVGVTQFGNSFFRLVTLLPGASIDGIHINLLQVLLLYLSLFCVYMVWLKIERFNGHRMKIK